MSHRMICAALACSLSCGTAPAHHVVTPTGPEEVEILWKPIEGPHVDVATLDAAGLETCGTAVGKLRVRAGALGCDALVIASGDGYAATCITYGDQARDRAVAMPFGGSP